MVVTMAPASHASCGRSGRRRRAGAGSGGMATARGRCARRTVRCARRAAARSKYSAVEPGASDATTNRRYSRRGDSATSARAKCGHRVLPPFVRFSAVFAGRARARSVQRSATRAHALLLHPAPHHPTAAPAPPAPHLLPFDS